MLTVSEPAMEEHRKAGQLEAMEATFVRTYVDSDGQMFDECLEVMLSATIQVVRADIFEKRRN